MSDEESTRASDRSEVKRAEAFSDCVFSIAITLLVLSLKVPPVSAQYRLVPQLLYLWPSYWGFAVSFFTILIMWINHHRMFRAVRRIDEWLLLFNGLLLMGVTFVPFPTGVLAEHLTGLDRKPAAVFYSATFVFLSLMFNLVWWCIVHDNRLVDPSIGADRIRATSRHYLIGPVLYSCALVVGFFHAPLCLTLNMLLAFYFLLPSDVVVERLKKRFRR